MITWALANWWKVIVGILILSITIYIGFLKLQNHALRSEADSLTRQVQANQEEIGQWKKIYTIMGKQLAEQNKTILAMEQRKKQSEKKRLEADKKAAAIQAQAEAREKLLRGVPAAPDTTCEAEMDTIKQLLKVKP